MKRNSFWNTFATTAVLLSGNLAMAEEKSEMATIRLSQGILRHDTMATKSTVGSKSTKVDESGFTTMPTGIELAAFFKGYAVYVSPLKQSTNVTVGKVLNSEMEAGVLASINSDNTKNGNELATNSIGVYAFYTRPITPAMNFESSVSMSVLMGSGKTISNTGVATKNTTSGLSLNLELLGVIPMAKNFEYAYGIDYNNEKSDIKSKVSGLSSTVKNTSTDLGIILAKFRYFI